MALLDDRVEHHPDDVEGALEIGPYPFVTHAFNFHDRGAHGLIQVGDGIPKKPAVTALDQTPRHQRSLPH